MRGGKLPKAEHSVFSNPFKAKEEKEKVRSISMDVNVEKTNILLQ